MIKFSGVFSNNTLKIIALIAMTIDHIGLFFFTDNIILRCIGRISFPIFAYFIAEGATYTRNFLKYFTTISASGIVYSVVFYAFSSVLYFSIFLTFSFSLSLIFIVKLYKNTTYKLYKVLYIFIILILIFSYLTLDFIINIDYGFIGIMIPFLLYCVKNKYFKLLFLIVLILINSFFFTNLFPLYVNLCALLSIPILILYNGERGKNNCKYLFYIYYPAHLIVFYLVYLLIN